MSAKKCLRSCFPCFAPVTNPSSAPPSAVASSQVNASADGTARQNAPSVPVSPSCSQGTHVASPAPVSQPVSFSAQTAVDKENVEIAPSPLVVITNPSPAATLTVESSDQLSSSASPSVAAYSQVNASTASTEGTPIAPTDAVSPSSQGTVITSSALIPTTSSQTTASPPSSSTPSSSSSRLPKESDHAKIVMEAAKAVDKENVDGDFSDLINYISELFRFIEEKVQKKGNNQSKPKGTKNYWPHSSVFSRLKEVFSEAIEGIKEVPTGDAKTIAQEFVKGAGKLHLATAGFLVMAYVLERYEAISTNEGTCLSILKEMDKLARHVNELRKRPKLKEGMVDSIREAIALIVEASIACCTQIKATKFSRFFSTRVDGEELSKFQERLTKLDAHMQRNFDLCLYDAIERVRKPIELQFPKHPSSAVGIEKPLKKVIELLECGSDKNVVAVTLHGFGGMGKTTLADAVFVRLLNAEIEGCRYSYVRLFKDITSVPDVVTLQRFIIKALKMGEEPKDFQRHEEGQLQIESILEKEMVFIYIDNVLRPHEVEQGRDALENLLPKGMGKYARKLRLLLTARDKEAVKISGVETKFYRIEGLHEAEALQLLNNTLDDDRKKQLNDIHLKKMVQICGGVPKLLDVVAGFINSHGENARQAYTTVLEESQENWKGEVGNDIERYVFAYDKLEDKLKDPFLDICSFFRGWDWKKLSDIVGQTVLEKLEKRALVTLNVITMTARVHDVILEVGLKKTKGERLRLTSATEIEDFLDIEDEDLKNIKGIWASYNKDPLRIPAKKLDLMSGSLRVLKLGPLSTVVEGKCEKKFNELVFFSAEISHLPFHESKFRKFKKLAHLCYHPEDLKNLSQMPSSLRHIEFELNSPAFEISSNCIKRLSNLRVLSLENAPLKRLPQEIGNLGNGRLEELELSNCQYLEDLPASISGLVSLRVLRMGGCSGLRKLPEDLGSLNSLQELYLEGCKSLETLPGNLESLTSLKELDLSWCESLKELPGNLGKLTSLQELHLDKCLSLEALPSSLEELSLLTILNLNECDRIKDLPCGLAKLTSLAKLNLYGCSQLSTIPESIGQLKLNSINLASSFLKGLPDGFCKFSTLTELDMTDCSFLEKLPERFGEITSLRKLRLVFCVSLKKLPESFSQLKNLEHLDLSNCSTLEELCKDFKGLSSLRVLSLEFCEMLKKLPEDFHFLTSLEVLDVRDCYELEGKWIDSLVNMKTLQILRIEGCWLLEERWEEIRGQSNQAWSCAVHTEQDFSNEENFLQQFQSKFDSMLTNGEGKPLNISGHPLNTLLLVIFDGEKEFRPGFPLRLLEENIDDIEIKFEMVYFGNHWDQLPKKVANRIIGHAPANRDVKALFKKLLRLVDQGETDFEWQDTGRFQMSAEIVSGENGDRYLSRWKNFSKMEVENFVVTKCGRYRKLKQLAGEELLRELFASGEKESSLGFFKKGAETKVGVDELQGKTILLDIRPANVCRDIPLQSLEEMYDVEKERFNFEIITVPIMQKSTKVDVSDKFSREVPWLVLQNPWQLKNATKYFLVEGCVGWPGGWERWYPNVMRIIKSDGTMAAYNNPGVLRMVNAWGAAAYPFTAAEAEKLIQKEKTEMEAVSHTMFLFRHLERVSEQLRKATGQQKMIWLCCCDEKEYTNSMKDVLTELSDIIYIIYIPNFTGAEESKLGYFTATIYECYSTLKASKMSSAEMQRMFSLSLSEHEAMRFWARMYSLRNVIDARDDQIQLRKIISRMTDFDRYSGMFIMNEDGNLITTEGKEIVKLLSEKYSDDGRVKELMQQLLKGTQTSWQKTLLELEKESWKNVEEFWKNAID